MKKQAWVAPFITILAVFTVAAIILGVMIHLGGLFRIRTKSILSMDLVNDTFELSKDIKELDVDASIGDLNIKYGAEPSVYYEYPKGYEPQIKCVGGKVTIEEKAPKRVDASILNKKYSLVITLPEDVQLEKVNIDMDMGNVKFNNIEVAGRFDVSADMGNVEIKSVKCGDFSASLDMGNLEIDYLECQSADADVYMGNIELKSVKCDNITADADMGNIEVYGDYAKITANCAMGNLEVKSDNPNTVFDVETDMGNCMVNGVNIKKH